MYVGQGDVAHLHKCIFPKQWAGQGGCCAQEARVCHFFHSFSNWKHQGGVNERHNDVGIKLICEQETHNVHTILWLEILPHMG